MNIIFRIPFTEYFLAKDVKLCLARKIWDRENKQEFDNHYKFIKI